MTKISLRARVGLALGALAAGGLAPASVQSAEAISAGAATTPSLKVVVTESGLDVSGPRRIRAGRVKLTTVGRGTDGLVDLARFRGDYTFRDFKRDVAASFAGGPDALKALNRAVRRTQFYGAPSVEAGQTTRGWAFLDKADTYVLFTIGEKGAANPVRLRVHGTVAKRAAPDWSAKVVGRENQRWGGDTVLPADGAIKFVNRSEFTPHFIVLQRVAKGTTRRQVMRCLRDETCTFDFARPGFAETGSLSPNRSFVFKYSVPRGTYALMCFFPDPDTGMPHAHMGMVRIVKAR